MSICRRTRGFRGWLLGLFVLAQLAGILPLIHDRTLNLFETAPVAGHIHVQLANNNAAPDADHHHGWIDLHDQCCALHTLAGPLPQAAGAVPVSFAGFHIVLEELLLLPHDSPGVLDPPPRPML